MKYSESLKDFIGKDGKGSMVESYYIFEMGEKKDYLGRKKDYFGEIIEVGEDYVKVKGGHGSIEYIPLSMFVLKVYW